MTFAKRPFARARNFKQDENGMNGAEARFAAHLEALKLSGSIQSYRFQPLTLKLAKDTRYTPDFLVLENSLEYTCYEVKGATKKKDKSGTWTGEWTYWAEEDAKVKVRVAAQVFPEMRFVIAYQPAKAPWMFQEVDHA